MKLPRGDGEAAYELIVGVDGSVWYHGRGGEPLRGVHTGRVQPALVHAILRAALDAGYTDDPSDPEIRGPQTTFYTSVLLDRRHVARTSPPGGPPSADRLVESADDLLAKTSWDPSPPHVPTDDETCPALARAIAGRCGEYLRRERDAGDCPYFLDIAADMYDEPDSKTRRQRCARHQAQMLVAPPATTARPARPVGPTCKEWLTRNSDDCLEQLTAGEFKRHVCHAAREGLPALTAILDAEATKTIAPAAQRSEPWCDDRVGGYAR